MSSLIVMAVVHAAIMVGGENSYSDAHKITTATGKPMVVLVGAEWCPACKTMKQSVMPQVEQKGAFGGCVYTVVDLDEEKKLGQQLTAGGPIPQLIMFRKTPDGWKRKKLIGGQSVGTVIKFIDDGVKAGESEKQQAQKTTETDSQQRQAAADAAVTPRNS